ncbi:unnamed protein product, partial [Cyprideis torosa]
MAETKMAVDDRKEKAIADELATQAASGTTRNLDMVLDIPVTLSMELGRTRISIRDLLQLNSGSVVELQRMADEPMDVMVNGTLVAHGEAVVIDDKFGIRLTDVIDPAAPSAVVPQASSLLKLGLMLAVVILMFLAFVWIMKRMSGFSPRGGENLK